MAANISSATLSRTAADGPAVIEALVATESAAILQVVFTVHRGTLLIGGASEVSSANSLRLGQDDPPLVLDFIATNPANGELSVLADGSEPTVFSVYTYGA